MKQEPEIRSKYDIMARILSICIGQGEPYTHIMYKCNVSVDQANKYIGFLVEKGLLEFINSNSIGRRCSRNKGLYRAKHPNAEEYLRGYTTIRRALGEEVNSLI